jgi:hypothetical protein
VITGFNTDIEHGGVTYHVQTEDKGVETPLILSLVYVGGAIIASKRTRYQDLIESGFDESALTERLQRQHKLICAAIKAGRIEDLKRMAGRDEPARRAPTSTHELAPTAETSSLIETPVTAAAPQTEEIPALLMGEEQYLAEAYQRETAGAASEEKIEVERIADEKPPILPPRETHEEVHVQAEELPPPIMIEDAGEDIYLTLLEDEGDFRAGQLATIKIRVGRGAYGQQAIPDAAVTIKVLGTTFRPLILSTKTGGDGIAIVRALLPKFTSGRAAIIIRASDGEDFAELRRIIHQA